MKFEVEVDAAVVCAEGDVVDVGCEVVPDDSIGYVLGLFLCYAVIVSVVVADIDVIRNVVMLLQLLKF